MAARVLSFIDRMPEQRDRAAEPQALLTIVTPQTFAALGIALKSGRPDLSVGFAAAAGAARLLAAVFDVRPLDAQVSLGVAVLLTGATLVAGYVPARRATALDPVRVLQVD